MEIGDWRLDQSPRLVQSKKAATEGVVGGKSMPSAATEGAVGGKNMPLVITKRAVSGKSMPLVITKGALEIVLQD